jgi:RNA polymerase sigma-70 factor (ECF subfamily)
MPQHSSFVNTRWSVVGRAGGSGGEASAALSWLVERYWEPLHSAARRWGCRDAEDIVQDFCCRLIERRVDLGSVSPQGGRFRTWLLAVFRNFMRDRIAHAQAAKRGGGAVLVDAATVDAAAPEADPQFDRDWAEALIGRATDALAAEHATPVERSRFERLCQFLTSNGTSSAYAKAGQGLGLGEGAVKVAVHRLRQRLRELARLEIMETLSEPTPEAIDEELRTLADVLASGSR